VPNIMSRRGRNSGLVCDLAQGRGGALLKKFDDEFTAGRAVQRANSTVLTHARITLLVSVGGADSNLPNGPDRNASYKGYPSIGPFRV